PTATSVRVPATASRSRAQSSALRAIGPIVSKVAATGKRPPFGTSPVVGRRPVTPHRHAGIRIEPPVSVPSVPAARSPAPAPPDPPLEPPVTRSAAHGFRAAPHSRLLLTPP